MPLLGPQLYAELRSENERLREALTETTLQLAQLKVELERATQVRSRGPGGRGGWRGYGCRLRELRSFSVLPRSRSALQRGLPFWS